MISKNREKRRRRKKDLSLFSHLFITAVLLFAVIYGWTKSYKKRGVAYMQIAILAAGSMLLGELFNLVIFACFGMTGDHFNIGMLGTSGCFFFTWSLAFGQIDGLGDDRSSAFRKYRMIALLSPTLFLGLFLVSLLSGIGPFKILLNALLLLPIAMTSYFSLKHLIIPDIDGGIFDTMRKYNLCLLSITLLSGAELVLSDFGFTLTVDILRVLLAVDFAVVVPVAVKGVRQWFN